METSKSSLYDNDTYGIVINGYVRCKMIFVNPISAEEIENLIFNHPRIYVLLGNRRPNKITISTEDLLIVVD